MVVRRRNGEPSSSDSDTGSDDDNPVVYENLLGDSPSCENFTITGIISSFIYVSITSSILYFCYVIYVQKILPQTVLGSYHTNRNSSQIVDCSNVYKNQNFQPDCSPSICGRFVIDDIFTAAEISSLRYFAESATMIAGGGSGPVSIIELHSSTVSYGSEFLSLQKLAESHKETAEKLAKIYTEKNLKYYHHVRIKVKKAIAEKFNIQENKLLLSSPSFFTRTTAAEPVNPIDNYFNRHSDTNQFPEFSYSAWVYLNTFNDEFTGGELVFDSFDEEYGTGALLYEQAVEPKAGRLLIFSSGTENPHHDDIVTTGVKLTFTLGFTCDRNAALTDANLPKFD